jgi:hypothetical protein
VGLSLEKAREKAKKLTHLSKKKPCTVCAIWFTGFLYAFDRFSKNRLGSKITRGLEGKKSSLKTHSL